MLKVVIKAAVQSMGVVFVLLFAVPANAQQTATPIISPGPGTYAVGQLITITDATPGAVIYYSEHNVLPTTSSTRYTGPISISGTVTIRAIAIAPGHTLSPAAASKFVELPAAAAPHFLLAAGTYSYDTTVAMTAATPDSWIYYTTDGTTPTIHSRLYNSPVALRGQTILSAIAIAPRTEQSPVTTASYSVTTDAPVFSPGSGTSYKSQIVAITDKTAGAAIYYTLDGSTPTINSSRYSSPLTVTQSTTVQAIAVAPGFVASSPVTANYVIDALSAPVLSPASWFAPAPVQVSISHTSPGVTIHYTTDGSTPTSKSAKYTNPITLYEPATLKSVAVASGGQSSAVTTGVYVVESVTKIAGNDTSGYSGDGGQAIDAALSNFPAALAFAKNGDLWIADSYNNVIRKITAGTGIITTVAGNGTAGYTGDGGPADQAELSRPMGIAFDEEQNLYIADTLNNVVREVSASTGIITTVAGKSYAAGSPTYSGDGGQATDAHFDQPESVAIDKSGNLFIADTVNNVVREVVKSTGVVTTVAGNGIGAGASSCNDVSDIFLCNPRGLAFAPSGDLYFINFWFDDDIRNIYRLQIPSLTLTEVLQPPDTLYYRFAASDLAFDSAGNLYIAEASNHIVDEVLTNGGPVTQSSPISVVAGNGNTGNPGNDSWPTSALPYPYAIAFDSAGNLYITEGEIPAVRKLSLSAAPVPLL